MIKKTAKLKTAMIREKIYRIIFNMSIGLVDLDLEEVEELFFSLFMYQIRLPIVFRCILLKISLVLDIFHMLLYHIP
jgi:hypothetical protein